MMNDEFISVKDFFKITMKKEKNFFKNKKLNLLKKKQKKLKKQSFIQI